MAFNFSKSKYCSFWTCPKQCWLKKYKPEEEVVDESVQARFKAGNEVGDLAMGLFGDFLEVTTHKPDGRLDLAAMEARTKEEMSKGTENICEASFICDGLYCAVDILRKSEDGYDIYEVKSSSMGPDDVPKAVYIADISYQKYLLEKCGVNVTGTYLVCIDKDYIRGEELDIQKLFRITDVSGYVAIEEPNVAPTLEYAERILSCKDEPEIGLSRACRDPYECGFFGYCTKDLPDCTVFDLYRMAFTKKLELYNAGIIDFEAASESGLIRNDKQLRQIDHYLNNRPDYIDKGGIKRFLGTLSYPLYFLDFETIQPAVPQFEGTKPYQQIPFQYSLHYIEYEDGPLHHKEFLAESGANPLRAIAESLCNDIPCDVCVTAYNKGFECGRLSELACMFPDLEDHLLNISNNMKDFLIPFQSGLYYNKAMGGSFSIKSVLPALFPNDPDLDYHSLDQVHNGGEAMTIFPEIQYMSPAERERARSNLLKYCCLDTLAMVKVWQKLIEVSK